MISRFLKNNHGTTLVEMLTVIGVLTILVGISVSALYLFQKRSDLDNNLDKLFSIFKLAQSKALASEDASQYGVFFDDSSPNQTYTFFKGPSFALRDVSFDQVHKIPSRLEIYQVSLAYNSKEVVFDKVSGATEQFGLVSLRVKSDPSQSRTIYIEEMGQVGLVVPATISSGWVQDTRHIHVSYQRIIDTDTETLNLVFPTVTQPIPLAVNLEGGQIYWEGIILVDGVEQAIKIHTHSLNGPDTQFCIHRDRRYNDKELSITLSGDGTGSIISYSADGATVSFGSIHVTSLNEQ